MSEHFIPCNRSKLIQLCTDKLKDSNQAHEHFYELCQILLAYVHHSEQSTLENLKASYAAYDPNIESEIKHTTNSEDVIETIANTLVKANYQELSRQSIHESLNSSSLIPVQTAVDFEEYDDYRFFYRNQTLENLSIKRWFRSKTIEFVNYSRMVVLLKTNATIQSKKDQGEEFKANKLYLYLYKNIPHDDLEMLFPNLKVSMTLKDKLFLIVPALGASIPLMLKVLPSLALLIGAVMFFSFGSDLGTGLHFDQKSNASIYALLTAVLSVGLALGGFAAQQYVKYKSKRLSFLKQVADTLFFKCLDTGSGVIHKVMDEAEEELCKEMVLVMFVLSQHQEGLTEQQIDSEIELWIEKNLNVKMDFHVEKALNSLLDINPNNDMDSLISKTQNDIYKIKTLEQCKVIMDKQWDNIFQYNS